MSNLILTLISTHLLSLIESELEAAEPAAVALILKEIQLLADKLESFITAKSPAVAAVVNPALSVAANDAGNAVNAAAEVMMAPKD